MKKFLKWVIVMTIIIILVVVGKTTIDNMIKTQVTQNSEKIDSAKSRSFSKKDEHKGTLTVSDLKDNPKLSAAAIIYYGTNLSNLDAWTNMKHNTKGWTLDIKGTGKDTKYFIWNSDEYDQADESEDTISYNLTGTENSQVTYHDNNDTSQDKTVPLENVVNYINDHGLDYKMKSDADKIDIVGAEQRSDDNSVERATNISVSDINSDENMFDKAVVYYGLHNASGNWANMPDSNEFSVSGGDGNNYSVIVPQTGGAGSARFQVQTNHGTTTWMYVKYYSEVMGEDDEIQDESTATLDEIVNFVNSQGGKQALNQLNIVH